MIILAAAIILSISNSGIMDKANKAKQDSDAANLKEYVNVLTAEWELGTKETSKAAYVNEKLADKYPNAALGADGEVYTGLNEVARKAIAGGIKIGDVVKYEVTSKTEISKFQNQEVSNKVDFVWRYIGVSDNGELLIAPDMVSGVSTLQIYNWSDAPDELNRLCNVIYSSDNGIARSMNIDDVTRMLGYTGETSGYRNPAYVPTVKAKTISEIKEECEVSFSNTYNEERWERYGDYISDYYLIDKNSDVGKMLYPENRAYVYYGTDYVLASSCVCAYFGSNEFVFLCMRYVNGSGVVCAGDTGGAFGNEHVSSLSINYALRPVVSLTSNITKNATSGVWEFAG